MGDAGDRVGDVSIADVTISKNSDEAGAPLSEVGFSPTSGEHPGLTNKSNMNTSVDGVPAEFFSQMLQMMKHVSDRMADKPEPKVKIKDIFLPSYDPDANIGVREWCQHITTAKETYNFTDYEIRMKAGSLLKGRAKLWVDNWLVCTATWQELRDVLITTFEPENRYSRDIVRFREHNYDNTKDIAQFLSQAWLLWRRITKDKLSDDDAVEAVIGCVTDERLRIELLNARATSVPELISVASSIRRVKRSNPSTSNAQQGPSKRPRFSDKPTLYCQICKRSNHDTRDCRFGNKADSTQPRHHENKLPQNTDKPSCTFCSKIGHTYETCYKRERAVVSKINCVGDPKLTSMLVTVGDLKLHAIFDSGAECSLIRESVAAKLPGKRTNIVSYLKGIGQFTVVSLARLTTVCVIDDLRIELLFHVVPDYEVCADILIGMNLIENTSLGVLVTSRGATLFHQPVVNHVRSQSQKFDNLDCDLTNDDQIAELKILLNKYEHLFIHGYPSTRVNTGELEIRLKDPTKYVERRPYRLSPVEREKVRDIVSELLEHNIIRESKSSFSSPIILVKKKNGNDRMCVDYRELNRNTLRDHYPLPIISDQIDQLAGGVYYSTFDMAAGFHQIPISETSIERTAFVTPDGLYEYLAMPFGLSNACSVYQRCINRALASLLSEQICQVYVDDVLSKCRDFSEGLSHIERILVALQEAGFSINVEKTAFFKRSIEYLGNVISDGQVGPSPRKVEALTKAPTPTNAKQVRQFNGLAGYFRRFIPNFSRVMVPLYELTKKDAKWEWNERHDQARNYIIKQLSTAPTLTLFQENAPIVLYTDASSLGYGAVLVQIINGRHHAVAYMSLRTTDAESRYHSYELETLAVVRAIKHFRQYLYGRKFKVMTDCNALKASAHKKDLLPRIHRWWAFLQNYDFEVEYRKGERLQHADFFSRNPPTESAVNIITGNTDWLKIEQRRDDTLRPLIDSMTTDDPAPGYVLEDGVLKKTLMNTSATHKLVVVPRSFQWSLINTYHNTLQHPGWEKTLQKLKESYWFDKMSTVIRRFVDNCVVCRTSKGPSGTIQAELHPIQKPTAAFQVIHMDITGKLGTRDSEGRDEYVIVTIDAYTKYILLGYSTDKSQSSSLAALKRTVHLFGAPVQVVVDGGREFLGEFKAYCDRFGINLHAIAPGVSRANGQVERVMSTLKNALTMIKNYDTVNWQTALEALQLAFNCTPHRVTGVAPLSLLTRREHTVPPELLRLVNFENECIDFDILEQQVQQKMVAAAEYEKRRFDQKKAKIRPFQRGDYVLIKNNPRNQTSLDLKYSEPYEIFRLLDNDRYTVKRVTGRGRPRKVAHDQLRRAPQPGDQAAMSTSFIEDDQEQETVLDVPPQAPYEPSPSTSQLVQQEDAEANWAGSIVKVVHNVKAQDEETPFLKIIANPTIVYNVGETKAIFCNSSIEPIEWYSPSNKKIERRSNKNTRVYVEKMSPLGGVPLIIHHIKITDAGNWTCKAGDLSDTIDMIVGEKVNITERNVDMDGDEGKAVRMTCEANGHPAPVVVWYKETSLIVNDHKKYVIRADNSLEIKKLDHMDVGTYVCKVRQKALSHYTDKTVHLSVRHKPILYNSNTQAIYTNKYKTEEIYAILNETKNITCSALANPLPAYHWYRRHDGFDDDEITDPDMVAPSEDGSNSVLMLRMEDETVLGEYKCLANNTKGSESIVFHVSLGTKPDPPDFVAAATLNATEIVFNVSCSTCPMASEADISPNPQNLTITGYVFELVKHKPHFEPDWDAAYREEVKIENQNVTLFTVGGLSNTTEYHVRVATINAAGNSEWYVVPGFVKTTAHAFRHVGTALLIITALIFALCY